MKAKLLFLALLTLGFSSSKLQSQTTVYAKNSDISDNLDLRAVASIFGESANLQDFERRLNDPKYQLSNLDLNGDDEVDYLRVIESVEDRTHVVIIQAVLDRDVYQDVATIDVERDNYNKVSVQVVGNSYLYGANYIYEPVYNVAPVIYTSFWVTNYRPYYSTWYWGYYPTYYTTWRPYPVYRYRNNINICINVNNHYNYVNVRRSYRAPVIYETRRSYGYEKIRPNYSFAQRHSNINNRYELDQRRVANRESNRNSYNTNRNNSSRSNSYENRNNNRTYADNRNNSSRTSGDRNYNSNRPTVNRDNTAKPNNPVRVENSPRTKSRNDNRSYSENRSNTPRVESAPRTETRTESRTNGSNENRMNSQRASNNQKSEPSRGYSESRSSNESRSNSARPQQTMQRSESPRVSPESRGGGQPQRDNSSNSRGGGGRRG
ncbi:hypothetical protein ACFFLS_25595 [Flavobacterium procerum]|uniref:DUF3300 domain-containing protein n=1 Tax=Flavobacterium procerum TaxID=1455569 RepID=A0ABV6BYC5_9FLAO